jgi:hypothetical protein
MKFGKSGKARQFILGVHNGKYMILPPNDRELCALKIYFHWPSRV